MFHTLAQDLALAWRTLLAARAVTIVAVASLAIGIAANATIFSLIHAVEFPALIYQDASRLVFIESRNDVRGLVGMLSSAPDADDLAVSARTLRLASLTADQSSILRAGNTATRVSGRRVAPTFFETMGVAPRLGRTFGTEGQGTIILADALWRAHFGADQDIVGRTVQLDGGVVTVIGVMPARFDADADFWTPLDPRAGSARDDRQLTLFARLADGVSLEDATRELAAISARLALEHPATNANWVMFPTPLTRMHGRDARATFLLLQMAVGVLLLIACANIANILLARGTRRRHEMAVRVSLGATRRRLVQGMLIESMLLALIGGALGVMLAMWGIRGARLLWDLPDAIAPRLNLGVLGFSTAVTMLTGILCGIVPALRASAVAPSEALREQGRGTGGQAHSRLRSALAGAQIASAVVLAVCGMLMVRTVLNRDKVDLGFNPEGAVRARLQLPFDRYQDPGALRRAVDAVLADLEARPGVEAAGAITWALPTGAGGQRQFTLPSERDRALGTTIRRSVEAVTPRYFDALGAPLRLGRFFDASDRDGSAPVVIVNDELAAHLWPGRNPVGESLRLGTAEEGAPVVTVVGVVEAVRTSRMHDSSSARVYVPYAQHPNGSLTLVVRGRGGAALTDRLLQASVSAADTALFVEEVETLEAEVGRYAAPVRLLTTLLGAFASAGLLLAALGVFGTMSYTVSQRRHEMAVRSALGARPVDLFSAIYRSALMITAAGVVCGLALAFWTARVLSSFLFGVTPGDPATYGLVVGIVSAMALAACYRPARMAAQADPILSLRH